MKPQQAQAVRRRHWAAEAARGEALRAYLENGGDRDRVVPDLIPTEEDRAEAERRVRKLLRHAERAPRGGQRNRKLDMVIGPMARLVYLDRVLELDALERAALTPAALLKLARVARQDLEKKLVELRRAGATSEGSSEVIQGHAGGRRG